MKKTQETVLLINCGCENVQKFARAVRKCRIYTMVMPYSVPVERALEENPAGLIFLADELTDTVKATLSKWNVCSLPKLAVNGAATFLKNASDVTGVTAESVDVLVDFCRRECGCTGAWQLEHFIDEAVADIQEKVGDGRVVLGLSGGVDSSVVAALIHKAIGDRLTCVFVNHGLLRKGEPELVREVFERTFKMKLCYIDASDRFLDALAGVAEPERKRKIIGGLFIDVFAEAAEKIGAPFLGQGTIYPDILESIPFDGDPASVIKSHHNVGGLPEKMNFKLVEPLERLFKDEVRQVGRMLGLPSELLDRHPFPGPSLGVRHLGAIDRKTLEILRNADAVVTEELRAAGWYDKTWQTFAVFLPVRTVGMKDGKRTYEHAIAIRSINSVDAVTADVVELPWELLFRMAKRIVAEVPGVNRVVYDITAKPPATIEWE